MNDQPDRAISAGDSVSPRFLQIEHESLISWNTWGMLSRSTDDNTLTVYSPNRSAGAATVAMRLNIFGVDAPNMGEWWLNASRKENEDWKAEIVPVRPHPHAGLKITHYTELTSEKDQAVTFRIVLPSDSALYTQGFPFYGVNMYSNTKTGLIQGRSRRTT